MTGLLAVDFFNRIIYLCDWFVKALSSIGDAKIRPRFYTLITAMLQYSYSLSFLRFFLKNSRFGKSKDKLQPGKTVLTVAHLDGAAMSHDGIMNDGKSQSRASGLACAS